jgi:hypothetical protein
MTDGIKWFVALCLLPLALILPAPPPFTVHIPSFYRLLSSRLLVQDIGLHQIQIPGPVSSASHARREDSQEPHFSMPSSPIKYSSLKVPSILAQSCGPILYFIQAQGTSNHRSQTWSSPMSVQAQSTSLLCALPINVLHSSISSLLIIG